VDPQEPARRHLEELIGVRALLVSVVLALAAGCGDKVPQSDASRKVGDIPAQTRDRAVENTTKALQQGADRNADAEKKQ